VFDRPEVSDLTVDFWQVLFPIAVSMSLFGAVIAYSLGRTLFAQQTTGVDEMVGLVGRCQSLIEPQAAGATSPSSSGSASGKGKVFVRGEYWNCTADESIAAGESVEIVGIKGLTLRVRKATSRA
jgi:membrane-bound ClpP family serine protease